MSEIDTYLDGLFDRLAGTGASGRRMLEEAAEHLHASAEEAKAAGLSDADAEREAVRRFGESGPIAAQVPRPSVRSVWYLIGGVTLVVLGTLFLLAFAAFLLFASGPHAGRSLLWAGLGGVLMLPGGIGLLLLRRQAFAFRAPRNVGGVL